MQKVQLPCYTGLSLEYSALFQTQCTNGYVHSMAESDAFWSLTAENDWVCDKAEYGPSILTSQSIGMILAGILFMQLSDT